MPPASPSPAAGGDDKAATATPAGVLTFEKSFSGKLKMTDDPNDSSTLVAANEDVYELEFITDALAKTAAGFNGRDVTVTGEVQRLPGIYKERHLVRVTSIMEAASQAAK